MFPYKELDISLLIPYLLLETPMGKERKEGKRERRKRERGKEGKRERGKEGKKEKRKRGRERGKEGRG